MSVFKSALDENRWFCRSRWHHYLKRGIPSEVEMTMMLNWLAQGADTLEAMLSDSAEDQQREEEERALLDAQAKTGH